MPSELLFRTWGLELEQMIRAPAAEQAKYLPLINNQLCTTLDLQKKFFKLARYISHHPHLEFLLVKREKMPYLPQAASCTSIW